MTGLWRNQNDTREGKFLVTRRDGTIPEWPFFVLGARDPAAPAALWEYAKQCQALGMDGEYVEDVKKLSLEFDEYRIQHGSGDPDAPPHREDDPDTIAKMKDSKGA